MPAAALESGELDPESALRAFLDGDDTLFAAWRTRLPGSPRALDFLLTSALAPLIRLSYGEMVRQALPYTITMTLTGLAAVWFFL